MPKVQELFIDTTIAGVTFEDRQQVIPTLVPGRHLLLKREKTNKYDKNAVLVMVGKQQAGYLPRKVAEIIAPKLDAKVQVTCLVLSVGQQLETRNWGALVRVQWEDKV
jgi:single-stranded-DNA-specific exonuclease